MLYNTEGQLLEKINNEEYTSISTFKQDLLLFGKTSGLVSIFDLKFMQESQIECDIVKTKSELQVTHIRSCASTNLIYFLCQDGCNYLLMFNEDGPSELLEHNQNTACCNIDSQFLPSRATTCRTVLTLD